MAEDSYKGQWVFFLKKIVILNTNAQDKSILYNCQKTLYIVF